MLMKCCSARISVGAMNATWRLFSIATSAAMSATIVFPDPTSSLQKAVHRLRQFHVADDLGNGLFLIAGQLERKHAACGFANLLGDDDGSALPIRVGSPPQQDAQLKEEELFEDEAPVRSERNAFSASRLVPSGGKCTSASARADPSGARAGGRRGRGSGNSCGSCASTWNTSVRCILVVSVPVFS